VLLEIPAARSLTDQRWEAAMADARSSSISTAMAVSADSASLSTRSGRGDTVWTEAVRPSAPTPASTFSYAQALLVGLTGCSLKDAAAALLSTATQLDLEPARTAQLLLDHIATVDECESEAFVAGLEFTALLRVSTGSSGGSPRPGRVAGA
jgi:hypothetical protein